MFTQKFWCSNSLDAPKIHEFAPRACSMLRNWCSSSLYAQKINVHVFTIVHSLPCFAQERAPISKFLADLSHSISIISSHQPKYIWYLLINPNWLHFQANYYSHNLHKMTDLYILQKKLTISRVQNTICIYKYIY